MIISPKLLTPEQFPSVVGLLAESYNPHVRYGAALALGIACAGTGNKEAIAVLEPMLNDAVNYVRQGVLIASALICIQHTEATCPKVKMFREHYMKVISDKHDDVMAKFGAILAHGILDAGGRNVTVSLLTRSGQTDTMSVVGLLVFTQFWYWFPLSLFLSLAFSPTCLVTLNQDLKMPNVDIISNAPPSVFAYPPPLVDKKEEKKEKVETAVLSITAKQKKREQEKKGDKTDEPMETDKPAVAATPATTTTAEEDKEKEKEKEKTGEKKEEPKKEKEPDSETLHNPTRVMKAQQRVISMPKNARYQPLKDITHGGIILVKDTQASEPEVFVELAKAGGPTKEEDLPEPEPPEPFEYRDE
ncbi:unnamed protein product [Didymodactylos carnosus]|uniref:26S proteasome regulatory subunit RPN2 C-terminal domain-containing protein n=1 Tax=Didymodactylos carnosus TaxID=1234261 RepID=A0A814D1P8_9BILA|nr:unnamed protein product [Didymodactylos carnosus]CAF0951031.1 unnamed protein product [Didymodactylos carnosus]CAF3716614.1 unnamed protein product [Didymodactylos carnosus]CAF3726722.1 unnamed protein product [Didymodactylos carnosus]